MNLQQLKKELLKYDSKFLADLIVDAINRKRDFKNAVLEKLNEKISQQGLTSFADGDPFESKVKINDGLLAGYWTFLRKIVSKSNKYGGCSYADENKAYTLFEKMSNLLEKEVCSEKLRKQILEETMTEHKLGNSGFDDNLMDLMEALCFEKEDWEFLVKYLEGLKSVSSYYKGIARRIRKERLQDEEGFLKSAQENLQYGMDYYELGQFYLEKNNISQAVSIFEEGIHKGQGRMDELFAYLFDYYAENKNDKAINQLVETAIQTKNYVGEISKKEFKYYKDNNYERAKAVILRQFKEVHWGGIDLYEKLYKQTKEYLYEKDWTIEEPKLLEIIRKRNPIAYLEVLLSKNEKKQVLDLIVGGRVHGDWFDKDSLNKIALKLKEDFPQEIADCFWKKSVALIDLSGRNNYEVAVFLLKEVKTIYTENLKNVEIFRTKILKLREIHQKKPAFMEVSRVLL